MGLFPSSCSSLTSGGAAAYPLSPSAALYSELHTLLFGCCISVSVVLLEIVVKILVDSAQQQRTNQHFCLGANCDYFGHINLASFGSKISLFLLFRHYQTLDFDFQHSSGGASFFLSLPRAKCQEGRTLFYLSAKYSGGLSLSALLDNEKILKHFIPVAIELKRDYCDTDKPVSPETPRMVFN